MTSIGSYEAKTHLPALLKRVEEGEEIVITRHGQPVARLVPVSPGAARPVSDAIHGLLRIREGHTLGKKLSVRDLIEEGRRR
ncbi:MAG: type II toxin-antitoxin system prevent-host-death family antitoxin [Gemmatimonadota bacterium]